MLTGNVQLYEGDIYTPHRYQMHPLGAVGQAENGDLYRYIYAGATSGTDVVAGNLYVGIAQTDNHRDMTVAVANVIGDTVVTLDLGATATTANEYDEGFLYFNDNSPEGEWYQIKSHEVSALSTECKFTLTRPLLTATVVDSSQATITRNPYRLPAISQLITEKAVGVAVRDWDVSAYEQYGWLKTRGRACCLIDGSATTVGYTVCISNETNGAVGATAGDQTEKVIGQMLDTGTAGEFCPLELCID